MDKKNNIRKLAMAAACAAVVPLSGCGLFSSNDPHEPTELAQITPQVQARVYWKTNVGKGASASLVPAVTGNALYAAGGEHVHRLDRNTGELVWKTKVEGAVTAGVGTDGNYVAVGTDKAMLVVLDAEGNKVWDVQLGSDIEVPPLVGAGRVIVKTSDTRITGFDLITGKQVWRYQGQVPSLTVKLFTQMAWSPAGALVPQANGRLLALNPIDGRVVFDNVVAEAKGITEVERLIDVVGRPWVDQELMCAAAFQGRLTCMRTNNAQGVWSSKLDAASGPISDERLVYAVDSTGRLHAFNRQNGREAWTVEELKYRSASAPIRIGRSVAVGDYDGVISFYAPGSGEPIARTRLSGAVKAPAAQYGYGAIFQTIDGDVAYVVEDEL